MTKSNPRDIPLRDNLGILRIRVLCRFRPDLSALDANHIANELGDLPLALHLAGSFLQRYSRVTASDYLTRIQRPGLLTDRALHIDERLPTGHERDVARTFALSLDRLRLADPIDIIARQMLVRVTCFAPGESFPRDLLIATLEQSHDGLDIDDALTRLIELGLLEAVGTATLRMHRLLAAFVTSSIPDTDAQLAVERVIEELLADVNKTGDPRPLLPLQSHLRAVTRVTCMRTDAQAALLCNRMGYYLYITGNFSAARLYWEHALATREQVLGSSHLETATSLNNLGVLLQGLGKLSVARSYLERALSIREQVLGPSHPETAKSLNNLSGLLYDLGDLAAARSYLERALAIKDQILGSSHPETATTINNLGLLLQKQGDLVAARSYFERALAIREQVLGPSHPETATNLDNLGLLLQNMNDLSAAQSYLERALAIREQVLGLNHPDTAISLNNLGLLLRNGGNMLAAQSYFECALTILVNTLGDQHPSAQSARDNLATLNTQLERSATA